MENENCDSDTSGELPDLYPPRTFDILKLEKNEIVWTSYKDGLYWPALVRSVDKKNRKVRVWYLDSPGKCFKVPFQKIHDFCDVEFNQEVYKNAKSSPSAQKHHDVCRRSLLFIFRRSRGIQDDPADFFDTSKPYFLLKDLKPEISESKFPSENTSAERVSEVADNLVVSSEGESIAESDEESSAKTKVFPELSVEDSPYDDEKVDKILTCIKAGLVDEHLMDIFHTKIASERHDLYTEAMKTYNTKLLCDSPSYIPINNHEKLHSVSIYLFDLYERKIEKGKPKMNEYVVSVWLPEAVDKAISMIESDSTSKATEMAIKYANTLSSISTDIKDFKAGVQSLPNGGAKQNLVERAVEIDAQIQRMRSTLAEEGASLFESDSSDSIDESTSSYGPPITIKLPVAKFNCKKNRKRRVRNARSQKKLALQKAKKAKLVASTAAKNASESDSST